MGTNTQHIIQRQTFLFDSTALQSMFALQERISKFCRLQLSGSLDEMFSRHISEDVIIRLDKLEIDAGTVSLQNLEAELTQKILTQIDHKLTRLVKDNPGYQNDKNAAIEKYTKDERFSQLFIFFLQHGNMPVWANAGSFENLREWLITSKPGTLRKEIIHLIEENARIADRLIDHFDDKVLAAVLYSDTAEIPLDKLARIMAVSKRFISLSLPRIRNRYWVSILHASIKGGATLYETISIFYELLQPGITPGGGLPLTSNRHGFFKSLQHAIEQESLPVSAEQKEKIIAILRQIIKASSNAGTRNNDLIEPSETKELPALQPKNMQEDSSAAAPEQNTVYDTPDRNSTKDAELNGFNNNNPEQIIRDLPGSVTTGNDLIEPSETKELPALQPENMQEDSSAAPPEQNAAHNTPDRDSTKDTELKGSNDNPEQIVRNLPGSVTTDNDLIESAGNEPMPGLLPEKPDRANIPSDNRPDLHTDKNYLYDSFQKQQEGKRPGEKVIYVHHAGIVLLHPFLATIFEEMKLIRERAWVNEEAQKRAVQILSYLSSGKEFCPEYEMPLLKFLCGLSLEEFVSPEIEITSIEEGLATELLEAVIQHWPALGTISPDGLRETFLQREGKLISVNEGWRLFVERKTVDILISKLPWGISMVKPPWMTNFLYVDWI